MIDQKHVLAMILINCFAQSLPAIGRANDIVSSIGHSGFAHELWTELVNAEDHCTGWVVDVKAFDDIMKHGISNAMDRIKGMQATHQGLSWYKARQKEFKEDPGPSCAKALAKYGTRGTDFAGLLKPKP